VNGDRETSTFIKQFTSGIHRRESTILFRISFFGFDNTWRTSDVVTLDLVCQMEVSKPFMSELVKSVMIRENKRMNQTCKESLCRTVLNHEGSLNGCWYVVAVDCPVEELRIM
jgi:hypothetical protein